MRRKTIFLCALVLTISLVLTENIYLLGKQIFAVQLNGQTANDIEKNRNNLKNHSIAYVSENRLDILNYAYPLAFRKLRPKKILHLSTAKTENGFVSIIMLRYLNLFKKEHYIEITFDYDSKGNYRSWEFTKHSDIVAPKVLTIESLFNFIN
jgi:hypothetical protein